MRMRNPFACAFLLALLTGGPASADIPVPGETPEQAAARRARRWQLTTQAAQDTNIAAQGSALPLVIEGKGYLSDTRLILPRKLLANLQASLNPGSAGALPSAGGFPLHTVLAGVALSLALVWVGLRLIRSPRRLGLVGVGALMLCAVVLGTGCPPRTQPMTEETYQPLALTPTRNGKLCGEAYVEVADSDEGVVLQVLTEKLEGFIAQSGLKTAQTP